MWAIEELTIEDFEGRRICERLGSRAARSKKRLFRVSRRCLSTALCVARRSAVLARRLGLRLEFAPLEGLDVVVLAEAASAGGGSARVGGLEGEEGVWGPLEPSTDSGEPVPTGEEGMVMGRAMDGYGGEDEVGDVW